ncbi:MAG: ATP-grasp domain-containing protein [Clostridia bacterium]|nr:ATP-grasp domain-containing protein [Clostridia bacterium]
MKALVLCGGVPQIALIKELKSRGITTLLADMNENVGARQYADEFYKVSVLDVDAIRQLAKEQNVDFLISVCADQVLQVVAQVSEELGLPCYIDFETAENVSKKSYMKKIFWENGVPTSKYVIMDMLDMEKIKHLEYPLIVKPVDAYSSRGVCKVNNPSELPAAFENAKNISRTKTAIVEEFVEGDEISVDAYVEDGKVHILCLTNLYKIGEDGKFVINRSRIPANISDNTKIQIEEAAQKIANAFGLKNTPMLVQLISTGEKISVVEFCARTGGGIKFLMIK